MTVTEEESRVVPALNQKIERVATLDSMVVTRSEDEDGNTSSVARGHASVFNTPTIIGSKRFGFVEEVAPGAFDDVLRGDTVFQYNHGGQPVARTSSNTLRLSQDNEGLVADADLAPTTLGRDLAILIDRGDINQMSFGFTVSEHKIERMPDDHADFPSMVKRTILKVGRLYDVSAVDFGAYSQTDIGMRSFGDASEDEVRSILEEIDASDASNDDESSMVDTRDEEAAAYMRLARQKQAARREADINEGE